MRKAEPLPYLSASWAEVAKRHVEGHPRFRDVTRGVQTSMLTLVTGKPDSAEEAFYVAVEDGRLRMTCGPRETLDWADPDFTITTDYATLAAIHRGQLDEMVAVITRKARIKGSILKAMRRLPTLQALNAIVREVPTKT